MKKIRGPLWIPSDRQSHLQTRAGALAVRLALAVFFFIHEKKSAREKLFWVFFRFFHGQKPIFTPTFWPNLYHFHAHSGFSRALFSNFLDYGEQVIFHGQKLCFYTENVIVLTGIFSIFFHGHQFDFHGHTFRKIFTGTFRGFFRYFHGHKFLFFHG